VTRLVPAAFTAGALIAAASTAAAGGSGWGCQTCGYSNGPELTGIAAPGGLTGAISAVVLPSAEAVVLH
jgi:hypothetical protein